MNSMTCGPAARDQVAAMLDNFKASILAALDRGERVTIHTHNEVEPVYNGPPFGYLPDMVQDFRYTGWTFGASIGEYPRRETAVPAGGRKWDIVHMPAGEPVTLGVPADLLRAVGPGANYSGAKIALEAFAGKRLPDEPAGTGCASNKATVDAAMSGAVPPLELVGGSLLADLPAFDPTACAALMEKMRRRDAAALEIAIGPAADAPVEVKAI